MKTTFTSGAMPPRRTRRSASHTCERISWARWSRRRPMVAVAQKVQPRVQPIWEEAERGAPRAHLEKHALHLEPVVQPQQQLARAVLGVRARGDDAVKGWHATAEELRACRGGHVARVLAHLERVDSVPKCCPHTICTIVSRVFPPLKDLPQLLRRRCKQLHTRRRLLVKDGMGGWGGKQSVGLLDGHSQLAASERGARRRQLIRLHWRVRLAAHELAASPIGVATACGSPSHECAQACLSEPRVKGAHARLGRRSVPL
mmetsp:Transcript_16450/g.35623  ORF Transcript_16450/g.35623 Transcript_16450/m.35623 type:complete len:259 (-) Transcript_16450:1032-1808(-)